MEKEINKLVTGLLDQSLAPGETLAPGVLSSSSKTVSSKTTEALEELGVEYVKGFQAFILKERDARRRAKGYFALQILARNFSDLEACAFILRNLQTEEDIYTLHFAIGFMRIMRIPLTVELDIMLHFGAHENWFVRQAAIEVLGHYSIGHDRIETLLISTLNTSDSWRNVLMACKTLQKVGTTRSLEALKKVIGAYKKIDILMEGFKAIEKIDGPNQVPYFSVQIKAQRNVWVKTTLTKSISKHGDLNAVDLMIDRVKKILAKKRTSNIRYGKGQKPEIIHALFFLKQYATQNPKIPKLKKWILEKKLHFLGKTEREWFDQIINDW